MSVSLRPASHSDIRKIYEWRNHPSVRKNSFQTKKINLREHIAYWERRLKDSNRHSFIIVSGKDDCGLLRIDPCQDVHEIHILIAPEYQGRGIGALAVALAKQKAAELGIRKLIARVKPGNIPSQRIFLKNGFSGGPEIFECKL
ncbi:MAG: GNAT family N-acetyltransferase [Candidatus Micrarchaeota archaeon]|nr:GNAT family N-acetyltransferase [Candidatus Micrarchaeota archaeon]